VDLTNQRFWDRFWTASGGRAFSLFSYAHVALGRVLRRYAKSGGLVCELGCGGSVWLPDLAAHGVDAWGIDYSEAGVALARRHLLRRGVHAQVVCGDIFDREAIPRSHFDVVFSLGLLEHFVPPDPLVQRFVETCKPGGIVITLVPNLVGVWGHVYRIVDPEGLAAHVPYTTDDLDRVHHAAGLETVEAAHYFGGIAPLVVNYSRVMRHFPSPVRWILVGAVWLVQQVLCWGMAWLPASLRNPPALAAHVVGVYRRPFVPTFPSCG
jgi:2-polyprenyl-3-methyl-5-hydroxy-6-metoxy-1,4-benzoquinol methylase